ncbi:MAG: aminotransferase class V-fold PLP-dependent enzyme [Simkaniaceae bacterium]|nr:aminotransferase class V-fold PLP-dependent enzyme [Simkaniaceae bacterium]
MSRKAIYLDHAVTTPLSERAVTRMRPFFTRHTYCPTAPYLTEKEPFVSIEGAVREIRTFLGAGEQDTFILTSCAAEAIAHVYQSTALEGVAETGRHRFVTLPTEDASFLTGIDRFKVLGIEKVSAPLDSRGILTPENLEASLSERTGLVSLSFANGLTGAVQPIEELAEVCRKKGVPLHVDVSDVLGKLFFRFADLPIDYLTFDGDRVYGPKGTGGLLIRSPLSLTPLIPDGTQQNGERGGTLNLPGLIGLGVAFQELEEHFTRTCLETARLRDQFEKALLAALPRAVSLFSEGERLPNVCVIAFPGVRSELLAFHLSREGVWTGLGGGRHQTLDKLLVHSRVPEEQARCALSFGFGRETTEEEMRRATGIVADAAALCGTFSEGGER